MLRRHISFARSTRDMISAGRYVKAQRIGNARRSRFLELVPCLSFEQPKIP